MILLDTGPIVAFFDASDNYHSLCIETLKEINEPLFTSWPVLTRSVLSFGFLVEGSGQPMGIYDERGCGSFISGRKDASTLPRTNEKIQ